MKVVCLPRMLLLLALVLVTILTTNTVDAAALSDEEALLLRVQAIWQAKKDKEWEIVYDMSDQKFRESVSKKKFGQRKSLDIKEYSISKVEIDPENQAKGYSMVIFKVVKLARPFEVSVKEVWLLENGQWNVKLSDPVSPFPSKPN